MLRGTPDHPKFVALQARLALPRPHVVGLLELLWHFTGRFAPEGDVGRWPDSAIEGGCGWDGEAGALVVALVACRWLDEDSTHRLLVHDWQDHADRYVKRRLARHGLAPMGDQRATKRRPTGDQGGAPPVAEPEPEPVAVPVPDAEPEPEPDAGPARPPVELRVVKPAMTPERQALKDTREAVRRELLAVTMLRGASDGQRELARASKTPGGQVIVNPESCGSLPWLRATYERLVARRMELEERQAEDSPPPPPPAPEVNPEAEALFEAVRTRLSGVLDSRAFATWIRPLSGLTFSDGTLVVAAPNRQFVEWVGRNYAEPISRALQDLGREARFELRVVAEPVALHAGSIR